MKIKQAVYFLLANLFLAAFVSAETEDEVPALEVIDPYLEMRSGPGRGYPVFYVIEEGEQVQVLVRQPGWYEVRSVNGKQGWVAQSQIARTMQASGEPADLPTISYGDYLKRGWQVGFAIGQANNDTIGNNDNIKANFGYRPLSWLVVEAESGKYFNDVFKGDYNNLNVVFEPFSRNRWSPAVLVGTGVMSFETQPEAPVTELDGLDDANYVNYGLRLNYYIGRNFLVNLEYKYFDVDVESLSKEMEAWYIGFNTFF